MREEYDFSNAKRAKDIPHLSKLQAEAKNKTCVIIMLDNEVLQSYREKAEAKGLPYQTLINHTLMESVTYRTDEVLPA
ncbi:BrnA antitoxin family protein [Candidatus Parabeggiatoa sp. HSG14]|uniref:BrnA antitoxin family protein n=1 Tax=Candidatus Parabeggiatoa sp. HSG14 TaxID=3055593 RepID=UPI0025A6ED2B|nr:BrnA antitoxin family protein [Thiotrichales bacterium HSG14]